MTKGYNNDNPISNTPHVREHLSDYMDGLLVGNEREAVRLHLDDCHDCRTDYIELRATQKMLQNMPVASAPRAFTLTPEMAGQAHKAGFWERFLSPTNSPRLATGSVLAFLVLFLVITGNFLGSPMNTTFSKISAGLSGDSYSTSAEAPAPNAKQFATDIAMAEPTATIAAESMSGLAPNPATGGSSSEDVAPDATEPSAMAQPSQSPPAASSDAQDTTPYDGVPSPSARKPVITPDTTVVDSGTSSPTTTSLNNEPTVDSGLRVEDASPTSPGQPSGSAGAAHDNSNTLWAIAQIALLALGLTLGAAAIIARRGI